MLVQNFAYPVSSLEILLLIPQMFLSDIVFNSFSSLQFAIFVVCQC